jgi:exodeoxyribonuclease VII small subunit
MNPEQEHQPGESGESPTFEASVSELQEIVGQLEDGSLALEESMRQFERGVALLRNCYQVLEHAEQRIEILTSPDGDGNPQTKLFDASSTMERQAEQKQSAVTPGGTQRRSPRDDASSLF